MIDENYSPVPASFDTFSIEDLAKLPKPSWNIEKHEQSQGLTMIHGDPGTMKTYIEVDKALKLAAGADHFFGHRINKQVGTLYILGEGSEFLLSRIDAWLRRYGRAVNRKDIIDQFHVIPHPVDISDEKIIDKIIATMKLNGLNRLGLDTYSRMMSGVDENKQDVISIIVNHLDEIKTQAKAHITLVHHNNSMGKYRGSTVLDGALDSRFESTKDQGLLKIVCRKMKNAPDNIEYMAQPIPMGESIMLAPVTGPKLTFPHTSYPAPVQATFEPNPFVDDQEY